MNNQYKSVPRMDVYFYGFTSAAPQAPVSGFDEWWSKMGGGIGCKLIARDAWKAALSTQPPTAELLALPDKWQPIETAPKDGTPILIWQPDNRHHDEIEGHKFDDLRYAIGYWRVWAQSDWSAAWGNRNQAHVNPTHWMPLPAPPQEGE